MRLHELFLEAIKETGMDTDRDAASLFVSGRKAPTEEEYEAYLQDQIEAEAEAEGDRQ